MTEAPVPAAGPIAAVLTDVDGTLITGAKVLTPRAIEAVGQLHERGALFAITSGRPPRGMRMLISPLKLQGPMAAFNGGIIVRPDMTVVEERTVAADVAPAVIDVIRAQGLYAWIYCGTEWYVTDPHAPHVAREAATVQFQPAVVPSYDGLLDRAVKIVGRRRRPRPGSAVRDRGACSSSATRVSASRSQPYYLDVTNPAANKGVVVERLSHYYQIPLEQIATLGRRSERRADVPAERPEHCDGQRERRGAAAGHLRDASSNEDEGFAKAVEAVHPAASGSSSGGTSGRVARYLRPAGPGGTAAPRCGRRALGFRQAPASSATPPSGKTSSRRNRSGKPGEIDERVPAGGPQRH